MFYTLYSDKIVLENEDHKTVAQLNFPEVEDGINEISHVFVDRSLNAQSTADRMMDKAISHFRKVHHQVIPACDYAVDYFKNHPEDADLVVEPKASEDDISAADETQASPDQSYQPQEQEPPQEQAVTPAESTEEVPEASYQQQTNAELQDQEEGLYDDENQGASKRVNYRMGGKRNQNPPRSRAAGAGSKVGSAFGAFLKFISRILQILSGLCAAGLIVLYGLGAYSEFNNNIEESLFHPGQEGMIFLAVSAALIIFLVIEFFWIMSKKKYTQFDRVIKIDTGRGIFVFILMIVLFFAAKAIGGMNISALDSLPGINSLLHVLSDSDNSNFFFIVSAAGAILSILRKMIGR
ncbi:MAG: N-acetyltransferase [Lachnospiraceae bacterium]|nr:N-acetyltransferase [Lachnospiraceae bacterium]